MSHRRSRCEGTCNPIHNNRIVVVGGTSGKNVVEMYDANKDSWITMSKLNHNYVNAVVCYFIFS